MPPYKLSNISSTTTARNPQSSNSINGLGLSNRTRITPTHQISNQQQSSSSNNNNDHTINNFTNVAATAILNSTNSKNF